MDLQPQAKAAVRHFTHTVKMIEIHQAKPENGHFKNAVSVTGHLVIVTSFEASCTVQRNRVCMFIKYHT